MSARLPFGWNELSPEAQDLLRDQPDRFERVILTDGPVAHGRLFRAPKPTRPAPESDLFAADLSAPRDDGTQGELF